MLMIVTVAKPKMTKIECEIFTLKNVPTKN